MKKIIAVLGPTASGKSSLAVKLAKNFQGEIINCDSRAFYKEMAIGTAKPIADDCKIPKDLNQFKKLGPIISNQVVHWLIDFESIKNPISAGEYQKLAKNTVSLVSKRGKTPFLVGGSGLYARVFLENYQIPKIAPDLKLRNKLEKLSTKKLAQKLKILSPPLFKKIDLKNRRRLIRSIEILQKSNQKFFKSDSPNFAYLKLGIKIDSQKLNEIINQRTLKMIENGWIQEVEKLHKKNFHKTQIFKSTIGYPEILAYLKNKISKKEMIRQIQIKTRQFAKRQRTWFRKEKNLIWIENYDQAKEKIKNFLN